MYFDIRDYLSGSSIEDRLIEKLIEMNYTEEVQKTAVFRNKYMNFYGDAARQTVDCIAEHIM